MPDLRDGLESIEFDKIVIHRAIIRGCDVTEHAFSWLATNRNILVQSGSIRAGRDGMREQNQIALLALVAATLFFVQLGGPRLWDEDEPRNAACAVEMLDRGDWVVPWFNGEIRTHKPVLLYWLMMSAYAVFGINEFSARFWSAALGVGTVMLTYLIGRRMFGHKSGLFAGFVLCSTIMFPVAARAATPDSALVFFMTAALAVFVTYAPRFNRENAAATRGRLPVNPFLTSKTAVIAMYALMGVATLDKGPVGFLLPTAIIGMYLLIARLPPSIDRVSWRAGTFAGRVGAILRPFHPLHFLDTCRAMRLDLLILGVLVVALPWYVWVTIRSDGAWTRGFFLEHNFGRAVTAMENHGGPPFYYLIALLIGFFPWSIFLIPFIMDLVRSFKEDESSRDARTFAVCWIGVVVGLFTLASTKLPSYVTPCYPAIAVLMGDFVYRLSTGRARIANFWPQIAFSVLGAVGLIVVVAIPVAATQFLPGIQWLGVIGMVLVAGGMAAAITWSKNLPRRSMQIMTATSALFVALLFGWAAPEVSKRQEIEQLMSAMHERSTQPHLRTMGSVRSSWVFYGRTTVHPVEGDRKKSAVTFVSDNPNHFLIATEGEYSRVRDQLPPHVRVLKRVPYFLEDEQLLLLGHLNRAEIAKRDETLR